MKLYSGVVYYICTKQTKIFKEWKVLFFIQTITFILAYAKPLWSCIMLYITTYLLNKPRFFKNDDSYSSSKIYVQ